MARSNRWGICSIEECDNLWLARTLCSKHHQQALRGKIPMPATVKSAGLMKPKVMKAVCKVSWCDRQVRAMGYCNAHYQRLLRGADMDVPHREPSNYPAICMVDCCERDSLTRGYCGGHYSRFKDGRNLDKPIRLVDPERGCLVESCKKKHCAKGYCDLHFARVSGRTKLPLDAPIRTSLFDPCGLAACHIRCRALWGAAKQYPCIACNKQAIDWAYDGTDPTERLGESSGKIPSLVRYSLYPEFYMPMCRKCHAIRDKAKAAAELREYRIWKHETGLTLADVRELLANQ